MKELLDRIRRKHGQRPRGLGRPSSDRELRLVRQVDRLRWELAIAHRDCRADALRRRSAERQVGRGERHIVRLERRLRRILRDFRAFREGEVIPITSFVRRRRAGTRRTWLTEALETSALPAHQKDALRPGGFIR